MEQIKVKDFMFLCCDENCISVSIYDVNTADYLEVNEPYQEIKREYQQFDVESWNLELNNHDGEMIVCLNISYEE